MAMLWAMVAAAAAAQVPAKPAAGRATPAKLMPVQRAPEYVAYRACLDRTVAAGAAQRTTPEDLMAEVHAACPAERGDLATMVARRGGRKPGDDIAADEAGVRDLVSGLQAQAITAYMRRYATGR